MTRRIPRNRAQRTLERPPRERYATRMLSFDVEGSTGRSGRFRRVGRFSPFRRFSRADTTAGTCRGRLYLPADVDDPPTVIMASPLGADSRFGYPAVAERLAAAGYAAFRFDYRGFGASDGDTQLIDPVGHQTDLAAAIDRIARVEELGDAVVLWGVGLGGTVALSVAGTNRGDVDGVIAIAPITDGRAVFRRGKSPRTQLSLIGTGVRDAIGTRFGFGTDLRIVGDPDESAVLTGRRTKRQFLDLVDRDGDWQNRTPARSVWSLVRDTSLPDSDAIRIPTLLLCGTDDDVVDPDDIGRLAEQLPRSTFVRMPADHFSVYSEDFMPVIGHVTSFLVDALDDDVVPDGSVDMD